MSFSSRIPTVDVVTLACSLLPPQDTGLYYDRYLREVIEVLETDPHFREKLQTANTEDIKVFNLISWLLVYSDSPVKDQKEKQIGDEESLRTADVLSSLCSRSVRTDIWPKNWTW